MAKKSLKSTAMELIKEVRSEVEAKSLTREQMIEEIKMMKFKIRPISGDVFYLIAHDMGFLESIWRLGKIEEIVSQSFKRLDARQKDILSKYLDDLEWRAQQKIISSIENLPYIDQNKVRLIQLEVFKDKLSRRVRNLN